MFRTPCSWMEGLISNLWEFRHSVWTSHNEIKHGITSIEQAQLQQARIAALITDRYKHRQHLDHKYSWLYKKSLQTLFLEGNRALYVWLSSVNKLSSISSGPIQMSLFAHNLYKRLSNEAWGRLRRCLRHLRRLFPFAPNTFLTTSCTLRTIWNIMVASSPIALKPVCKPKQFKKSVRSHDIRKMWDRGRSVQVLL